MVELEYSADKNRPDPDFFVTLNGINCAMSDTALQKALEGVEGYELNSAGNIDINRTVGDDEIAVYKVMLGDDYTAITLASDNIFEYRDYQPQEVKEQMCIRDRIDTDVIEYMKTSFSSAEISDVEWKDYIDNYNKEHPDDGLNYDGTSGGSVADIKATEAASEKDSDSTSKSAVSTADESPIGTMSVLAAFSLLAGGYVLVRKRKKEDI